MANKSLAKKIGNQDEYLVAEGTLVVADADASGNILSAFRRVGSLAEFSFSHEVDETEIRESESGNSKITETIYNNPTATLTMGLRSFTGPNYNIMTLGNSTDKTAAVAETQTNITVKAGEVHSVGTIITTDTNPFVMTDNATGLITYEEGKNYEVGESGLFEIYSEAQQTNLGAANIIDATTGVVVDITYDTPLAEEIQAFQNNVVYKALQFGVVKKSGGQSEEFLVKVPLIAISPSDGISFLSPEDPAVATVTGKCLDSKINPAQSPYVIIKTK